MFAWLCNFRPCKWLHVHGHIYQCSRCKTVSAGVYRDIGGEVLETVLAEIREESEAKTIQVARQMNPNMPQIPGGGM